VIGVVMAMMSPFGVSSEALSVTRRLMVVHQSCMRVLQGWERVGRGLGESVAVLGEGEGLATLT